MRLDRYGLMFFCCVSMVCALLMWSHDSYAIQVTGSNITEGQWVDADAKVRIQLDHPPAGGELRIFLGTTDLTALFDVSEDELVFQPGIIELPDGENEIKVYVVQGDAWNNAGSIAIRVREIAGFDRFEVTPRLDLNVKAQLKEGHSPDAGPPPRSTFHDLTGQGGLGLDLARDDFSMNVQSNFIGSSFREEALRFGQKGNHAPKMDLADYLVSMDKGNANLSIGHYQYQGSRYVLSQAFNRGVSTSYSYGERVSLAATAQNTTEIVGYDDILGINKADNRTYGIKAGGEFFERPGALRIDGFASIGKQLSNPGFNVGEITDAEESSSAALRISASTPASMFNAEVEAARSSFTNPIDPALDQGFGVVPVRKTSDNALFGRIVFNAYQGQLESGKPLMASLSYEHERIDPLFKTVGAFPQADLVRDMFSLNGMMGDVSINASTERRHDNLDDLTTVLTTETRNSLISASMSLKSMVDSGEEEESVFHLFLPSLSASYNHIHQFAANRPDLDPLSGFAPGHLPDQLTKVIDISSTWSGDIWSLTYSHNRSKQDNRQAGRENDDFTNILNGISAQIQLFDQLSINAGISRNKGVDQGQLITTYTLSRNIGLNWVLFDDWTVSGNLETSRIADSLQNSNSKSLSANAQIAWQYYLPGFGEDKIPGQAYLRYDRQINNTVDNLFAFQFDVTNWAVLAGVSVSLF